MVYLVHTEVVMYVQQAKLNTFQYEYEPQDSDGSKLEQDCSKDF